MDCIKLGETIIVSILIFSFVIVQTNAQSTISSYDFVSYWNLDEGIDTVAADSSRNGINLELINGHNNGFHVVEMEVYTLTPIPISTPTPTPTPEPNLIWRGDWEDGTIVPAWKLQTIGVELVTNPVRTGKYAAKFTVKPGQEQWSVGNERAMVGMYEPSEKEGDELYYSWSTRLGDDWRPVSGWGIFTQWHAPKPIRPAAALMLTSNDNIYLGMCTGDVSGSYTTATLVDENIGIKMQKGVWNDFIVHAKWTTSNNGLIEIWYKTENEASFRKVYTKSGIPTLQYGYLIPVISSKQQGLYRSNTPYTQTIYHDGYRIGTTFESVLYN